MGSLLTRSRAFNRLLREPAEVRNARFIAGKRSPRRLLATAARSRASSLPRLFRITQLPFLPGEERSVLLLRVGEAVSE